MWICLADAFLSIVDKGDPSHATLLVRARRADGIAPQPGAPRRRVRPSACALPR